MRRERRAALALVIPALVVGSGLWILLFTPNVVTVTTVTEAAYSHLTGVMLVLFGLLGCLVAAILASEW